METLFNPRTVIRGSTEKIDRREGNKGGTEEIDPMEL